MFSEIYGSYYLILEMILARAMGKEITKKEIDDIVARYGFLESNLYFTPDAVAQSGGYNLLLQSDNGYTSVLKHPAVSIVTGNQKRFLKTMLCDKRVRLFLQNADLEYWENTLIDIEPLYDLNDIVFTETSLDGDPYDNELYQDNFRCILSAIRLHQALRISFDSAKGKRHTFMLAPWKLEFGLRDDKFRLCGVSFHHGKAINYVKVNVARMTAVTIVDESCKIDFKRFIKAKQNHEPIEIVVTNERNGFERVFIGLSNYERVSTYDEETGTCTMKIYYTDDDEPELLILLMSFGPVIRVTGPQAFLVRFAARIKKQVGLFTQIQDEPQASSPAAP